MDESVMNFESEVKSHASETITRTVIIREQVVAEVRALDGDGLSRLAIAEIELFRARAGDSSSPRPAWVDGAE
jgi:hypothetical protein